MPNTLLLSLASSASPVLPLITSYSLLGTPMLVKDTQEKAILQALQELNPFEGNNIVKSHHIWDDAFIDVPSINAPVSDQIFEIIERSRKKNTAIGITLIAPRGTGKTHMLSRIRHKLKAEGDACFIYLCEYGNLSSIKSQFLNGIALSLRKLGRSGTMQWQELAIALLSKATKKSYQPKNVVAQFPRMLSQHSNAVEYFANRIVQEYEIDPYIARAIVWTLSPAHAPYAINWLSGRDLSEVQAKALDLPELDSDNRDSEAFSKAIQILNLIASYTVPVICFDELDGTEIADEDAGMMGGYTRAMVVVSLGKDVCNSLTRGVILTAAYERTWKDEIKAMTAAADAVIDRLAEKHLELKPLKPDDAVNLVTTCLKSFYEENQLSPPHNLYPFVKSDIQEYGDGATVRELLQWCAKNIPVGIIDSSKRLEQIYQKYESDISDFEDDNDLIANSLALGLEHLLGKTIEGVTIKKIETKVKPYSKHGGCIQFRVIGEENGSDLKIGVAVAQQAHGRTVGTVLKNLVDYKGFDLTRGCLVRRKTIQANWAAANKHRETLCQHQGGEWISFLDQDIKPLIVLYNMHCELDGDLFTPDDWRKFVDAKFLEKNSLLLDILSDPSGCTPTGIMDEDLGFEEFLAQNPNMNSDNELELELTLAM